MKVTLTANSHIKLPNNEIIPYGYYYKESNEVKILTGEESFSVKLLSHLEKALPGLNQISKNQQLVVEAIASVANHVNKLGNNPTDTINIQINASNAVNRNFAIVSNLFLRQPDSFNTDIAHIPENNYKMIILGAPLLVEIFPHLQKVSGITGATTFTVFHELSHILEKSNTTKYGDNYSESYGDFWKAARQSKDVSYQEKITKSSGIPNTVDDQGNPVNYGQMLAKDLGQLSILASEIYADVSGFLNMRNFQIENAQYNRDTFIKSIEGLAYNRQEDYLHQQKKDSFFYSMLHKSHPESNILRTISHLTSSALVDLKASVTNDKNILTEETIHQMSVSHVEKGMAKVMYALLKGSPNFERVVKDLCQEHGYQSYLEGVERVVGVEWLSNFNKEVKNITTTDPMERAQGIFRIDNFQVNPQKTLNPKENIIAVREKYQTNNNLETPAPK